MENLIIGASIDLSKLDKAKIKEGKNGAKYYDLTLFLSEEPNQFGQHLAITTAQTKEERAAQTKNHYIGNGKIVFNSAKPTSEASVEKKADDLPWE
jgi:hypothetical protein